MRGAKNNKKKKKYKSKKDGQNALCPSYISQF